MIVTLVYLALQIRKNTQAVRSASLDSVATSHIEFQKRVGEDPQLTKLWFNGLSGKDLPETEGQQFVFLLISLARHWERAFHKSRVGALEDSSWAGIDKELTLVFANPGAQAYWKTIRHMFTPDFVAFLEQAVGSEGPPRQPTA